MSDETRTDESRGYADSPEAHDRIRSRTKAERRAQNVGPSKDAHDKIVSRTPEERRAERAQRDLERKQATLKGADGIAVSRGTVRNDGVPNQTGVNNGGVAGGVQVVITGNFDGVRGFVTAYCVGPAQAL